MSVRRNLNGCVAALVLFAVIGSICASDAENGRKIFQNTGKSGNGLACGTCHDGPDSPADNVLRPAHPMTGVLGRPSFWGGTLKTFGDAADFCARKFMQLEQLNAGDKADLEAFVAVSGKDPQPALELVKRTRKQLAEVTKLTGDAARGKEIAERSCVHCHGKKGPGPVLDETLSPGAIIAVIISSGGKIMPFFAVDRLSDQQVADAAAYVSGINKSSK